MRWKLIAGNVVALLIVGLVAWMVVRGRVQDALAKDVQPAVTRGTDLLSAVRSSEGEEFKTAAVESAGRPELQAIFALASASEQNTAAYEFANHFAQGFTGPQIELVVVANADGRVLARNVDPNADRNRNLREAFEVVDQVIQSRRPARDLIKYDGQKWYDVAVTPVLAGNDLRGILLVGFEVGDGSAKADGDKLGEGVGYVLHDQTGFTVPALSFGTQTDKDALAHWANDPAQNLAALFNGESPLPVREVTLGDNTWLISARAMPGVVTPHRQGQTRAGFIVLQNLSEARAAATPATLPILLLMLLGLALIAGYNIYVANYLETPIEQVEEGLLKMINGDRDHRIEIQHAELGGIIYRINQLVAELTGAEEEADESGRISHPPPRAAPAAADTGPVIDESAIGGFNPAASPADAALAQQLASEPENDYYDRIRREYQAARSRAGLGADGFTHEQFVESLRASEQMLAQKHALTLVRFQVQLQGKQVVLRAIPIR